ncbi:L-histidine N(alpha)-methyltransferase [Ferrovibrio xuzhouensis]|uniref:L-histidine N(Alpha)-methyltransferase n=1 Tax=Ferrovibrio xuzhouensis TaxID=1576914 RepID=A0ABV7VFD9_9PROT
MNSFAILPRNGLQPQPDSQDARGFAADVQAGLRRRRKAIPSKYFYDTRGSALFEQICELPEYYPTRTECTLLEGHAAAIADAIGADAEIVEFGAGATRKVRYLLDTLDRPRGYLPIDISGEHLEDSAARLRADYPGLPVTVVAGDYTAGLDLPAPPKGTRRRAGFFPGSTIGNFTPAEALGFLAAAARLLKSSNRDGLSAGGLLIGVDLVKDPAILHAAYNDAAGVTGAFNLNVLHRIRRELDSDIDPAGFDHYAFYEPRLQRIEMHLVSRAAQTVRIGRARHSFAAGESIHTENSCKYTLDGFGKLARRAGFRPAAVWCDPDELFSIHWLEL